MLFGIDVGGTRCKFGLYDGDTLIKKWSVDTPAGSDLYGLINSEIEAVISQYGMPEKMGFAIPGPVRKDGYCEKCPNIPGFDGGFPAEKINYPVTVCNDANAAALAECCIGAGKKYNSIIMITIGTGIGFGFVLDGEMWTGSHGVGGEIGHTFDGNREFEKLCSARAMAKAFGTTGAKEVIDAAKAGDEKALKIIDDAMEDLGRMLANLTLILDPEAFIIGGGVSAAGELLLDRLRKYYDRYLITTGVRADIVQATLGNDAGIYGAAHC